MIGGSAALRARGAALLGLVATLATVLALWPGAGVPAWPGATTGLLAVALGLGPAPAPGAKACACVLGSMAAVIGAVQLGALAAVAEVLP